MTPIPERWGERTILRVEDNRIENRGVELILRLQGDPRKVEREEIVDFLEQVLKELKGEESQLQGSIRSVKFGSSSAGKKRRVQTETHAEKLQKYVTNLCVTLSKSGRKNLAKVLYDLAQYVES